MLLHMKKITISKSIKAGFSRLWPSMNIVLIFSTHKSFKQWKKSSINLET